MQEVFEYIRKNPARTTDELYDEFMMLFYNMFCDFLIMGYDLTDMESLSMLVSNFLKNDKF